MRRFASLRKKTIADNAITIKEGGSPDKLQSTPTAQGKQIGRNGHIKNTLM